ncbi:hypothetical protein CLV59_110148 [Chitinophaga dinghuensis]|uniref:Uncharacterized protein n=1 Tax=Chitinophaga dinghuensis TaxID=1539050 RepID=A0A327VKT0_9BACT|nr:hypothetical protein [Chitinophaga dinghuensis]RAJ75102.1 hypothetical protein CLV59_110148 [Chitinophaga dinghuensis]
MWSNLYGYYEIRNDAEYTKSHPTENIVRMLLETGVLLQKSPLIFENRSPFPWLNISVVYARDGGFAVGPKSTSESSTLLSVVTSKRYHQDVYLPVLTDIAKQLGWQLILEEDDEDNEQVVLYAP